MSSSSKKPNPFAGLSNLAPEIAQATEIRSTMMPKADTEVMLSVRVRSKVRKKLKTDSNTADRPMGALLEQLILDYDPRATETVALSDEAMRKLAAAAASLGESKKDVLERLIAGLTVVRSESDT